MTSVQDILAVRYDRRALAALHAGGYTLTPDALAGCRYRGHALGMPAWVEALTWRIFRKTFHRDPVSGALRGWNVRIAQDGPDRPDIPLQRRGETFAFGFYAVAPHPAGRGVLLDYGRGGNPRLDPSGAIRSHLVALDEGGCELLLGWTSAEVGPLCVRTPSFFLLEHDGPLDEVIAPPRAPA